MVRAISQSRQPGPCQLHDGAALRRLVLERREQGRLDDVTLIDARQRHDARRKPVAERDRASLVEEDHVHVARCLDGATAHGQDVEAGDAVHARDADRGEQTSDCRGDQADEQGHEHNEAELRVGVEAEWPDRRRREQEDDRQAGQEDEQRDLVGRPLPFRALHEGDHPVEERLAGVRGDAHRERVAGDRRAARNRAPDVGARLLEDRRRLTRDDSLVDVRHALDHVAVARDRLAIEDHDDIARAEEG